jgi:uncharacterized membrane protein YiaA
MKWWLRCLILLFLVVLLFPKNAYAYLDLGSGSYFFQLITVALFSGLFMLKAVRDKIWIFIKNLFSRKK